MENYLFITNIPICKTCGKPMKEWNPWQTEFECLPCTTDRISDKLVSTLKKQIKKLK